MPHGFLLPVGSAHRLADVISDGLIAPLVLLHSIVLIYFIRKRRRSALQLDFLDVWQLYSGLRHIAPDGDLEHLAMART